MKLLQLDFLLLSLSLTQLQKQENRENSPQKTRPQLVQE